MVTFICRYSIRSQWNEMKRPHWTVCVAWGQAFFGRPPQEVVENTDSPRAHHRSLLVNFSGSSVHPPLWWQSTRGNFFTTGRAGDRQQLKVCWSVGRLAPGKSFMRSLQSRKLWALSSGHQSVMGLHCRQENNRKCSLLVEKMDAELGGALRTTFPTHSSTTEGKIPPRTLTAMDLYFRLWNCLLLSCDNHLWLGICLIKKLFVQVYIKSVFSSSTLRVRSAILQLIKLSLVAFQYYFSMKLTKHYVHFFLRKGFRWYFCPSVSGMLSIP